MPKNAANFGATSKVLGHKNAPLSKREIFFFGHGVQPSASKNLGNGDYHTKFTGDYYKVLTAQDSLLDAVKAVAGSRWDDSVSVWIQGCA